MAIINDTTLRDGEQAPYVSFTLDEKLKIATLLYESGADELEVGIPAMGKKEQEELKEILNLELPLQIMSWNRATLSDLEASLSCGVKAVDLLCSGANGRVVGWRSGKVIDISLEEVVKSYAPVDVKGDLVATAKGLGISFGE
jgi:homocitrate synthase NifV